MINKKSLSDQLAEVLPFVPATVVENKTPEEETTDIKLVEDTEARNTENLEHFTRNLEIDIQKSLQEKRASNSTYSPEEIRLNNDQMDTLHRSQLIKDAAETKVINASRIMYGCISFLFAVMGIGCAVVVYKSVNNSDR